MNGFRPAGHISAGSAPWRRGHLRCGLGRRRIQRSPRHDASHGADANKPGVARVS